MIRKKNYEVATIQSETISKLVEQAKTKMLIQYNNINNKNENVQIISKEYVCIS